MKLPGNSLLDSFLLASYLHKSYIQRAAEYNFPHIKERTFASANQDIWLFL